MLDMLFAHVLDMTLRGSVVIVAVMLVRLVLRKAPKVFSYALWAVVLFRLLCPVSIELPVSIVPDVGSVAEDYRFDHDPITVMDAGKAVYQAVDDAVSGSLDVQQVYVDVPTQLGNRRTMAVTLWEIGVMSGQYLWFAGMLVLLCYGVNGWLRLRSRLVGAERQQGNIWLADHINTPFVLGLFRPKIYLPSALDQRERAYIIAHEQHHIRRFDHIIKFVAFIALMLHWFNPLVWVSYILFCKDMEMSCDEAVIKKMGEGIRADYSASLLNLSNDRRSVGITPLAFGEGDTKGRIKNLAQWRKPLLWVVILSTFICLAAAICLLTDPTPKSDELTGPGDIQTGEIQPAGVAPDKVVDIQLSYAGYTGEASFHAAAENSDRLHLSSALHLPIYKFDTKEQLDDFTGIYGKFLSLNQGYEGVPSFYGAAERYDEAFFDENTLMLVYVQSSSGSNRYGVDSIYCASNYFCVHVKRTNDPHMHTDDLAGWFLMISVPDSVISGIKTFDADMDVTTLQSGYLPSLQVNKDTLTGKRTFRGYAKKTDLSGLSQKVKDAVADEWKAYDMLTPVQRSYSSRLFGEVTLRADTWQQTETDLGLKIKNPVMNISWLSPTDVYGGIATSDEILHTETNIYATDVNTRSVEQISVSAGYRGEGQRVVLKATVYGENTIVLSDLGEAEVEEQSYHTGSGITALVTRDSGEKYTAANASWMDQNVCYSLRVIGQRGQDTQVSETLQKLLKEI